MSKIVSEGFLEIICGPMFAGKTEELLRILNRLKYAKVEYIVFKPLIDSRTKNSIGSRNGQSENAIEIKSPSEILDFILKSEKKYQLIAIDEAQFLDQEIIDVCLTLANNDFHVIVTGLDKNFKGEPFGYIPQLMVYANKITKLSAICTQCGCEAHYSQRLISGEPANYNSDLILIGDTENYEARCLNHFIVPDKPISKACQKFNKEFNK